MLQQQHVPAAVTPSSSAPRAHAEAKTLARPGGERTRGSTATACKLRRPATGAKQNKKAAAAEAAAELLLVRDQAHQQARARQLAELGDGRRSIDTLASAVVIFGSLLAACLLVDFRWLVGDWDARMVESVGKTVSAVMFVALGVKEYFLPRQVRPQ